MQSYQTNIGTLYQQTKLRTYPEKFCEPTNHTTKRCLLYINGKLAIALQKDSNMLN